MTELVIVADPTSEPPVLLSVTPESAGWAHTSLWIVSLSADEGISLESEADEILVVPLAGSAAVTCGDTRFELQGRASVFDGPTDFAYVGRDSEFSIDSEFGGRFALCGARAAAQHPFRYVAAEAVAVEQRGAGNCSRQVHNFATADEFEADSIIACEVITPGGNWSSYPSHKHDESTETETELEEIYYFEIAPGPTGERGFGYQRIHGTPARPIELLTEVHSGDAVLVPHGFHGPSIAAPGHDMYYLNVMAGPGDVRAWRITDDPEQAWIRAAWTDAAIDPRLPFGRVPDHP
jgi:5-deoxy-glucuronate isomerase